MQQYPLLDSCTVAFGHRPLLIRKSVRRYSSRQLIDRIGGFTCNLDICMMVMVEVSELISLCASQNLKKKNKKQKPSKKQIKILLRRQS
ncbi:hypothetical protein P8452_57249 [Trifolium repens]|nr:hypothetical protein P8452_57249 [Trifolium repens]